MITTQIQPGIYRHRDGSEYELLGVGVLAETCIQRVICRVPLPTGPCHLRCVAEFVGSTFQRVQNSSEETLFA